MFRHDKVQQLQIMVDCDLSLWIVPTLKFDGHRSGNIKSHKSSSISENQVGSIGIYRSLTTIPQSGSLRLTRREVPVAEKDHLWVGSMENRNFLFREHLLQTLK